MNGSDPDPPQPTRLTALLDEPSAGRPIDLPPIDARRFSPGWVLGRGGMGVVLQAEEPLVGREVAVKHLGETTSSQHASMLVAEARIQGRLDHPAIPPVFDLGLDREGRPCFAMRKVEGETLGARLNRLAARDSHAPAQRDRLLRLFVDLCNAIEHAHLRGVVHLDLKPNNIMIGRAGNVYVLDWGVAQLITPMRAGEEQTTPRGGTLGYAAPEMVDSERPPDPRADVYSLGCILFAILALEPLHRQSDGLLESVLRGADARPSTRPRGRGTPPELEQICVRATARDPRDRHGGAGELAAHVTSWLDSARDLALRKELARRHLAASHDHLARSTTGEEALIEASRALALAPDDPEAARLVRSLLEREGVPEPARAELEAMDRSDERTLAKAAAISYLGFLLLPLTLLAQGGANPWFVATVLTASTSLIALSVAAARGRGPSGWLWWSVAGLGAHAVIFSRYLGPFLVTPGIAALGAAGAMMHPRVRARRTVIALLCGATLVPFALELAGVLSPTMTFEDGRWWLSSSVSELHSMPTMIGLALTSIAFVMVAILIGSVVAAPAHRARRTLAAQAWHLERLLGSAPGQRDDR